MIYWTVKKLVCVFVWHIWLVVVVVIKFWSRYGKDTMTEWKTDVCVCECVVLQLCSVKVVWVRALNSVVFSSLSSFSASCLLTQLHILSIPLAGIIMTLPACLCGVGKIFEWAQCRFHGQIKLQAWLAWNCWGSHFCFLHIVLCFPVEAEGKQFLVYQFDDHYTDKTTTTAAAAAVFGQLIKLKAKKDWHLSKHASRMMCVCALFSIKRKKTHQKWLF